MICPPESENLTVCLFISYLLDSAPTSVCLSARERFPAASSPTSSVAKCDVIKRTSAESFELLIGDHQNGKVSKRVFAARAKKFPTYERVFAFSDKREFHFHFGKHKHMILNWMWVRVDGVYIRHFTHVFDLQFSHRRVYFIFILFVFLNERNNSNSDWKWCFNLFAEQEIWFRGAESNQD